MLSYKYFRGEQNKGTGLLAEAVLSSVAGVSCATHQWTAAPGYVFADDKKPMTNIWADNRNG
jgi:hypothetical protein